MNVTINPYDKTTMEALTDMRRTLQQYLEKDKERLMTQLQNADTPAQSREILESQVDRLLFAYNEEITDPMLRSRAAAILQTGRTSMQLVDCLGETQIWEKRNSSYDTAGKPRKHSHSRRQTVGMILSMSGCICLLLLILTTLPDIQMHSILQNRLPLRTLLAAAGGGLLFLGGRFSAAGKTPVDSSDMMISTKNDAAKLYRSLLAMTVTADSQLSDGSSENRFPAGTVGNMHADIPDDELKLYAGLLEALYYKDGSFALDRLSQLPFYLHLQQIELADYSREHDDWFDYLPAAADGTMKTIRPAMHRAGKLVYKGLVTGGSIQ